MYFPKRNHRTTLNSVIVILVVAFFFLWGPWNWVFDDSKTLFDDVGHIVYGLGGGFLVLYLKINYTARGAFLFVGKKALMVDTVMYVMAGAAFWELAEFLWDALQPVYFPTLFKAQYNLNDTMIDMFNAFWAVLLALALWRLWRWVYAKYWPNDAEQEEFYEIQDALEHARNHIIRMRRIHMKSLREKVKKRIHEKMYSRR